MFLQGKKGLDSVHDYAASMTYDMLQKPRGRKYANSLRQFTKELHVLYDELQAGAVLPEGLTSDCCIGCFWCCYLFVQASVPEVLSLIVYLQDTLDEDELDKLKARVEEAYKRTAELNSLERNQARVPCPLLENGQCMAYDARPLSCAYWNSSSAKSCQDAIEEPPGLIQTIAPHFLMGASLSEGVEEGLARLRLEHSQLELVEALHIGLANKNALGQFFAGQRQFKQAYISYDKDSDTMVKAR